jgi:hypothetical protein
MNNDIHTISRNRSLLTNSTYINISRRLCNKKSINHIYNTTVATFSPCTIPQQLTYLHSVKQSWVTTLQITLSENQRRPASAA